MACGTIFTKIKIEVIILFLKSQLVHTFLKFLNVILSLASTDDLTDSRHQTVHSCNSLVILIHLHVECFDLLRIVCYKYRFLKDFFCQITLMLCLQIASPEYFVIKFIIVFLQKLYRFCISNMAKFRIQYVVQSVQKSFINEGIEEIHLFRSIFEYITDDIFQHCFCQIHIVI